MLLRAVLLRAHVHTTRGGRRPAAVAAAAAAELLRAPELALATTVEPLRRPRGPERCRHCCVVMPPNRPTNGSLRRHQSALCVVALIAFVPLSRTQTPRPKILCLHGGGQSGASFRSEDGIASLMAALPQYEFVFPDAPHSSGDADSYLWIRDPPGGKSSPTTDPAWADDSLTLLDTVLAAQGPFYGILGYSQGSAFVPIYLAHAPLGTFRVAFMFCGYLTDTHRGLLGLVESASPFGGIPALVWMGNWDWIITNPRSVDQAGKFTEPAIIASSSGTHAVPDRDDPTWNDVVAFMEVLTRNGTEGGGDIRVGTPNDNLYLMLGFLGWLIYLVVAHAITGCVYCCSRQSATRQGKELDCPKAAGFIVCGVSLCFAPCVCAMLCMGASLDTANN
jgi:pimeloyl-ACP methyl ester carboxylesterase